MDQELILTKSAVLSALLQHRKRGYYFEKHIHKTFELYSIQSGQCFMDINNQNISCQTGDVILIMPNTVHSFYLSNEQDCDFQHIHFTPALFSKLHLKGKDIHETDLMSASRLTNNFYFHGQIDKRFSYLISSIIEYANRPDSLAKTYANLHLIELLVYILEKSEDSGSAPKPSALISDYVSFTIAYIHKNYMNKILISNISNLLGISSRYLSKVFFEQMNITIANYINVYRINQSIDMMIHTNLSLTEISSQIGLKDSQHFSKLFRNIIGITPYKYKKMIQNTDF